jgi:type III restriction enzyme
VIHTSKLAFVSAWLNGLIARFSLVEVNQQKFLVRNLLEQHINQLREQAIQTAYQNTLLNDKQAVMTDNYAFEFPLFYATNRYYEGKYGIYDFQHHYYGQIGDFDSKEEFHCACYLDQLAEQKKIVCWLRNVARGNGAFFLQKATGKFYPDFVCLLPNDSILVVEYKGADRWKEADDERQIGQLWAELSAGKCLFVMVTKEQFFEINAVISRR